MENNAAGRDSYGEARQCAICGHWKWCHWLFGEQAYCDECFTKKADELARDNEEEGGTTDEEAD